MDNLRVIVSGGQVAPEDPGTETLVPDTGSTPVNNNAVLPVSLSIVFVIALIVAAVVGFKKLSKYKKAFCLKTKFKRTCTRTLVMTLVIGALFAGIVNRIIESTKSYAISKIIPVTVENLDLEVDVSKEGDQFAYGAQKVTVDEATAAGYKLYAYVSHKDLKQKNTAVTTTIANLEYDKDLTTLGQNTWGMSLTAPEDETSTVWQGLSESDSQMILIKSDMMATEAGDENLIYYGVNANDDLTEGTYGTEIKYVAISNVDPDRLVDQIGKISYADAKQNISNPNRGAYLALDFDINPDTMLYDNTNSIMRQAAEAVAAGHSLMRVEIDLAPFSGNANASGEDLHISDEQLESLDNYLDILRKFGLKVIIRCAYDYIGTKNQEPKSLDMMLDHMESIATLINDNQDMIILLETGMLGPWGEMHSMSGIYAEDSTLRTVVRKWLELIPEDMTLNVRTPHHYKVVFGSYDSTDPDAKRVGIFNDALFGSDSDMGTFKSDTPRDEFIEWMNEHGNITYYGGESTKVRMESEDYTPDVEPWSEGEYAAYEAPLTHLNYLNARFNSLIIEDKWANQTYRKAGDEYDGETYKKYMYDHLGYRFVVRNSLISKEAKGGDLAALVINLDNVGFGRAIDPQNTYLMLEKDGHYYQTKLDMNISDILGGTSKDYTFTFNVPAGMETGEYNVYLKVVDEKTGNYPIQFANADIYDEDLGANKLGTIKITDEGEGDEDLYQINTANPSAGTEGTKQRKVYYVPVNFKYYIRENGERVQVGEAERVLVARGATITATDAEGLAALGLRNIPEGNFRNRYFTSTLTEWHSAQSITIPVDDSEAMYYIEFTFEPETPPTPQTTYFKFEFVDRADNTKLSEYETTDITPGMVLDINDAEQFASLGLVTPEGYDLLTYSASFNDWQGVTQLTVPSQFTQARYWITIMVKQHTEPVVPPVEDPSYKIKVDFVDYDRTDNTQVLSTQTITVTPGVTLDIDDQAGLEALGLVIPEGFDFYNISSNYNGWTSARSITFPTENYSTTYYVTILMKASITDR